MKKLLILTIALAPLFLFSQGMKITWEDLKGREFSLNTHTGIFQYSMIAGDKIDYNDKYDDKYKSGIVGKVKSVGNVKVVYYDKYDDKYKSGIVGYIKSVGGLKVYYNEKYDDGPTGSIKNSSGSVN